VGADEADRLRSVGEEQLRGVLPLLDRLPADQAEQVRAWLVDVAIGVAKAAPDRDTDEVITLAEAAAIEQVAQILTGRAG
jgi:hypothetical protein